MSKTVNLGGERLGSGAKINAQIEGHGRSSFNQSSIFYSDMNCGTLVPFMCEIGLPGTTADINLAADAFTLPTVGPMFGTYKLQLDVFKIPIRLYQSSLHMNRNEVGQDMDKIILPLMNLKAEAINNIDLANGITNEKQINPSSLFAYLGVRGIGRSEEQEVNRDFNALFHMAYWDIYKNMYANKQEKVGKFINARENNFSWNWVGTTGNFTDKETVILDNGEESTCYLTDIFGLFGNDTSKVSQDVYFKVVEEQNQNTWIVTVRDITDGQLGINLNPSVLNPAPNEFEIYFESNGFYRIEPLTELTDNYEFIGLNVGFEPGVQIDSRNGIETFELKNIDQMRLKCLKADDDVPFYITDLPFAPFSAYNSYANNKWSKTEEQNLLAIKTFQSDRFNNWLNSEYIDKVNKNSAIDVSSGSFTMDALNLAKKVYNLENQITVAGGTYQDWQEVVYGVYGGGTQETPMYVGGLQSEITFGEVVSNAAAADEPLGTLAGKGKLANFKGGRIMVKCSEPSLIMGIVSITPRLTYSQGNKWYNELQTMDDFHKPEFDAIAYQDLLIEEAAAWSTKVNTDGTLTKYSGGKQTSWIEYQTNVPETYGGFADQNKLMFMVNDRQYEPSDVNQSGVIDWSTYIDPSKFNYCFADTTLDSRNFWIGISKQITMRRVMSAKQIPNL